MDYTSRGLGHHDHHGRADNLDSRSDYDVHNLDFDKFDFDKFDFDFDIDNLDLDNLDIDKFDFLDIDKFDFLDIDLDDLKLDHDCRSYLHLPVGHLAGINLRRLCRIGDERFKTILVEISRRTRLLGLKRFQMATRRLCRRHEYRLRLCNFDGRRKRHESVGCHMGVRIKLSGNSSGFGRRLLERFCLITGTIRHEKASDHYRAIECKGETVLDLGCGRWGINEIAETSPGYFIKQGASRVIGVDQCFADVDFYGENLSGIWIHERLKETYQIRSLLASHFPTLLKVDIEGDEILLFDLDEEDLASVSKMAIEYHSETLEQGVLEWAEGLGFKVRENHRFTYGKGAKGVLYLDR